MVFPDVQSWWEVPCIAHFCSLFRLYFELLDFDIEELEEALVTDGVEDSGSSLLQDLIVRLLRGCFNSSKDDITTSNYQMYLRRLFRIKCEEDPTKNNPFDGDLAFHSLPLRTKVEILRDVCDFRLDNDDVPESLKTLEAESLRVEPLGQDSGGSTYWYFYGTRLYREDYSSTNLSTQPVKKRGKRKQDNKSGRQILAKWQVVCFTEQDWQILTQKFKNCKSVHERGLHRTLRDDFLPELPRLFAEKEKLQRKRMLEQQLRRNGRSYQDDHHHHHEPCSSSGSGPSNIGTALSNGVPFNPKQSRIRNSSTLSLPPPPNLTSGAVKSAGGSSSATSVTKTTKARRGYDDENSWCSEEEDDDEDDDNNNRNNRSSPTTKIRKMDERPNDDDHEERDSSLDEEEARKKRQEQEKADRLMAEEMQREERKARLHLRERRGASSGGFSGSGGSRNSSSVSTERPSTKTISNKLVAAAVSKKNCKASPVKVSPSKSKSSHGKKGSNSGAAGRMTNNSLSVSLTPLVDDEGEGEVAGEVKGEAKDSGAHDDTTLEGADEETSKEHKKKAKSSKSSKSSKKGTKKKKKHSQSSRSPSPSGPTPKRMKKSSPSSAKKKASHRLSDEDDDSDDHMKHGEHDEFLDEEEEADYEEIVSRTLHNNNTHKSVGEGKTKGKSSKDKLKSKSDERKKSGSDLAHSKKSSKGSKESKTKKEKKLDRPIKKSSKEKESSSSSSSVKKAKSSSNNEPTACLIGASTMSLGGGTSKTKVKSSVLFSQSEEDVQIGMHKVIEAIKNHKDAWPFINPVDEDYAPNYYRIIDHPMDLQTMEDKLDNQEYNSLEEFKTDFARIVDNCRKYNGPVSEYTEMVETVEEAFNKLIQRYIVPDESDEEISIEYANTSSERKRPRPTTSSLLAVGTPSKKKEKESSKNPTSEHRKENEPHQDKGTTESSKKSSSSKVKDKEKQEKLERKKKKQQLMRHHSRDSEAIENLSTVAAETLKDINKWLGDTPKPPEYGSSSSPAAATESKPSSKSKVASRPPPLEDDEDEEEKGEGKVASTKKTKKLAGGGGQKRKVPVTTSSTTAEAIRKFDLLSKAKKARSTQFVMDEDDEYNIDRDLSPPPPKISKKGGDESKGSSKSKGVKTGKETVKVKEKSGLSEKKSMNNSCSSEKKSMNNSCSSEKKSMNNSCSSEKKSMNNSSSSEKTKKDKSKSHKHRHSHKEKSDSLISDSPKLLAKKSAKFSSSSSSVSSLSTTSSSTVAKSLPPSGLEGAKGKSSAKVSAKSSKAASDDNSKKPKPAKRSGGHLMNSMKGSAAFKRMNQISRATKLSQSSTSSSGETPKFKSDFPLVIPGGFSNKQQGGAAGGSTISDPAVTPVAIGNNNNSAGNGSKDGASAGGEKKKCLLLSDLPADKDGGPKLSLGSVLSTDAIKLGDFKENDDAFSDEDEFKPKSAAAGEEIKPAEKEPAAPSSDTPNKEQEEEEEEFNEEDFEVNRKLEPSKGFNREKSLPNLSAWIKAFGGPAKSPQNGAPGSTTTSAVPSSTASPIKKPDPESKNKFRVMGRGVGETDGNKGSHATPKVSPHQTSVIKGGTSVLTPTPSPSSVRPSPAAEVPSWNPVNQLAGPSPPPPPMSNPTLNPIKQAALDQQQARSGTTEDLSSSDLHHTISHHPSKKHRNRKMSSSSLSSQSESGSPLCVSNQDASGGIGASGFLGSSGSVVNPPRWVDDHWGQSQQSPSASSHVSSQSPAGPNSPFSPTISSPPHTPQTPPRLPAVRVGFYQDITSQHSSPDKVNESQSNVASPSTPPTPNSVHGGGGGGSGVSSKRSGRGDSSSSSSTSNNASASSSSNNKNSYGASYPTPLYAPRYVASSPSPNIVHTSSSTKTALASPSPNGSGMGNADSPGNPNSPHSPKVVNMSSSADYRSHSNSSSSTSSNNNNTNPTASPPLPSASGRQTPAHQQSSRASISSVLHSSSSLHPYSSPVHYGHGHSSGSSLIMEPPHLRGTSSSGPIPEAAHNHHHHSHHHHSSSIPQHAHHQTPAHAHSNPQTSHLHHLGPPQQAHAGNQYDSGSRYPPNLPHAHQQSSPSSSSAAAHLAHSPTVSSSSSTSSYASSQVQNMSQAHAHSRTPNAQPAHLSHPYPSNPYASNPRSINVAPNVYNNPISSDPAMNRYYKAAMAAAAASSASSELSLSMGGGGSTASTASALTSSSSSKRSSRSNASANAASEHHPHEIPRSASVNPTAAAAVAAALEGKLGAGDLNGFHWPHNLASLTQIVNSIPNAMGSMAGAYRHYDPTSMTAESMSKYQRAAVAAAQASGYPVTTSSAICGSTSGGVITSVSAIKSALQASVTGGGHHSHGSLSSHGDKSDLSHESSGAASLTSSSKKQSKSSSSSSSSESKSSRSQNANSKSSQPIVPGSAFNFSSLTPDLALYSKEMSEPGSLYSASPPTLTPPLAHRSEFYPTSSASFHSSFSAAARTTAGGVPTPPLTPYQIPPFIGSHPSPYQPQPVSSQPFAAHSQSSRGLAVDPYQQLFQGSPHVMGLLPHTGYTAPYAHPHSSLGFNRPGWI